MGKGRGRKDWKRDEEIVKRGGKDSGQGNYSTWFLDCILDPLTH
jgi:hypothetical protein